MKRKDPTRRDLVKRAAITAAGAIAAPHVLASTALGRGRIPSASERVNLGHIGVGGRGAALLREFLNLPDAQCVAVCDCFEARRVEAARVVNARYAERDGASSAPAICEAYVDFRDLLARDDIDAVVIATPDHWHVPIAIMAVRAGKDVYVEKPLGVAMAWNQALRSTVQRYGAIFQYGTQQRSSRNFRFACELTRNGHLGELQRIEAWCPGLAAPGWYETTSKGGGSTEPIPVPDGLDYDMWLGPAPKSPYTKDRCTEWGAYHVYDNALGFIAGWGAHPLDIAQWGNGTDDTAPIEYEATGTIPTEGLFDTISEWDVHCRYANGVGLRLMNTKIAQPVVEKYRAFADHGTTFFGPDGWVSVDRGGIYASDPKLLETKIGPDELHLYASNHHAGNFIECVRSRSRTVCTVEAAVQSDLISHLGDICIRTGRPIRWDPTAERIVDDEAATRMLNRPLRSPWRL